MACGEALEQDDERESQSRVCFGVAGWTGDDKQEKEVVVERMLRMARETMTAKNFRREHKLRVHFGLFWLVNRRSQLKKNR